MECDELRKKISSLLLNNLLELIDFKSRGKLFQSLEPLYFIHLGPIDVWQPVR